MLSVFMVSGRIKRFNDPIKRRNVCIMASDQHMMEKLHELEN